MFLPKKYHKGLMVSIVLLLIALLLLVWRSCETKAELLAYQKKISNLGIKQQTFKERIEKDGTKIAEQEQLILTKQQATDNDLLRIVQLRKIKSQVNIKTITKIDSVFVPFIVDSSQIVHDTIFVDSSIANISFPKKFRLSHEWYSLGGEVKDRGVQIDSIRLYNDMTISTGLKSQGIFKRPKPVVLVDYQNPYVSTRNLSNITIKDELKFYDRKLFWFGLGFIGGATTTFLITK